MSTTINVGVQNDGHLAVDFADDDNEGWSFNELTIEEGQFLLEELTEALQRARRRFPNGTPPRPKDKDEEPPAMG